MTRSKRRRSAPYHSPQRHYPSAFVPFYKFFSSDRGKQLVGLALLGATLIFYGPLSRQLLDFNMLDNGEGGPGWHIGEIQSDRQQLRSKRTLSEARIYALEIVNRDRHLNGLAPLKEDPLLSLAAQHHAEDMLTRQFYDHINPDGEDPSDRFQAVGGQTGAGENISEWQLNGSANAYLAYGLVEKLQQGWMYSDGHRANLLNLDYQTFGYGIAISADAQEVYAVQLFSF